MAGKSSRFQYNQFSFFYTNKSPFSQFYKVAFEVDGVKYSCAEQYMMHQKAVLFEDKAIAGEILLAEKPMAMKALGRKVKNFNEQKWRENREKIVKKGNVHKFSQNHHLKKELMKTKGTLLVEASPGTEFGVSVLVQATQRQRIQRIGEEKTFWDIS